MFLDEVPQGRATYFPLAAGDQNQVTPLFEEFRGNIKSAAVRWHVAHQNQSKETVVIQRATELVEPLTYFMFGQLAWAFPWRRVGVP